MQNSPQFMMGYYGILRANAVVVPLTPMNLTPEILRYARDAGASTMLVSQELYPRAEPLLKSQDLEHVIVAAYSDYLKEATTLAVPDFITAPRIDYQAPGLSLWKDVLAADVTPGPLTAGPDDLCWMPYTSGTPGQPKGGMSDRNPNHDLGFLLESQCRQVRLVVDSPVERRRRGDAGRGGATSRGCGHYLCGRIWFDGDHRRQAYQSRRSSQAAMLGDSHLRYRFPRHRSGHVARIAAR